MRHNNYHTALKKEACTEIDYIPESKSDILFVNDITQNNYPSQYKKCDLFYSEPAWIDGYEIFLERAEKKGTSTYDTFLTALTNIINNCGKPVVMIIGKKVIRKLPKFDSIGNVRLHGYATNVYGWGIDITGDYSSNVDIIQKLAKKFNCVGDFCCGYGLTGEIFAENGKEFVLSDINPKCITYIYKKLLK